MNKREKNMRRVPREQTYKTLVRNMVIMNAFFMIELIYSCFRVVNSNGNLSYWRGNIITVASIVSFVFLVAYIISYKDLVKKQKVQWKTSKFILGMIPALLSVLTSIALTRFLF